MTLVAGVDSSTQSCKVLIVDSATGATVRSGRAPHPTGTEVNPDAWWDALQIALREAGGIADVAAISIGAQQHGMVALDDKGRVVRDALLWNDTRSAAAAEALIEQFGAAALARRTGSVPVASFTATKLRWLRDAEPQNASRVAAVALPHDWLTWRLRGFGPENPRLDALTTDRSDASGTGYWSPGSTGAEGYDRELLIAALGHDALLPRVLEPWEAAGTLGLGAPQGTGIVAAGCGDNAGAALGLGAATGDVVVSIGTSGTVFAIADRPTADASGTVAGFADASGRFLPIVVTLNAARIFDAIAGLLNVSHAELSELALAAAPGSSGLVLQPWFEGERTPNLPNATATLFGMTLASTNRVNLARAAFEATMCGLAEGLDALAEHGVTAGRILLIGGAAQSPAAALAASQVFETPVTVPTPDEYVARGAAAQAAWALTGERPNWSVAALGAPRTDFQAVIREQYRAHR